MNATRVPKSAGPTKPGITITVILLAITALRQGKAEDITYTFTGVLTGGWDRSANYVTGPEAQNMNGVPFTLAFTFDGTKGETDPNGTSSGIRWSGKNAPGKAVLTINDKSFTYGGEDRFTGGALWRSGELIGMSVSFQKGSFFTNASQVDVRVKPLPGRPAFTVNYKDGFSRTDIDTAGGCFIIIPPDRPGRETRACFDVKKVEVSAKPWWRP